MNRSKVNASVPENLRVCQPLAEQGPDLPPMENLGSAAHCPTSLGCNLEVLEDLQLWAGHVQHLGNMLAEFFKSHSLTSVQASSSLLQPAASSGSLNVGRDGASNDVCFANTLAVLSDFTVCSLCRHRLVC